jgi:hypothetical protein
MYKRSSIAYTQATQSFKTNTERIDYLRQLSSGKRINLTSYDSDLDISDMAFAVGDVVWVLDPTESNYTKATVERVVDFMLMIRYVEMEKTTLWIDYENEYLIPVVKND